MSIHSRAAADPATQSRSRWTWMLLAGLAFAQLSAFWLLCSHQVRRAEARHNETEIHQMALADCLQYIPGSTIASCTSSREINAPRNQASENAAASGAVPVSFSYR